MLLDSDGALTGGTITFDLFYDMSVATPGSTTANYSQTTLNLLRSTDSQDTISFSDGLLSNNLTGGTGTIDSGHYSLDVHTGCGRGGVLHALRQRHRERRACSRRSSGARDMGADASRVGWHRRREARPPRRKGG